MSNSFIVKNDYVSSRLDRWFRRNVCDVPQSLIEKNIRKGNIKINNKKKKSSYKLRENDLITVKNINFSPNKNKKKLLNYKPTKKDLSSTSSFFIENNENFVVINKPSGIAVQSGTKSRRNILDILKESKEFNNSLPFPVHRIDKETSGVLIVAKNRKYAQLFTSLFRIRKIHKVYLGIVLGELDQIKGSFIDQLTSHEGKKIIKNKAITHYKVIDQQNNYSLLKLSPVTGRKHQLRKQLLMRGCPVLGDSKYRIHNNTRSKNQKLMLHAYKINFTINDKKYNFFADPPFFFKEMLKEKNLKISE